MSEWAGNRGYSGAAYDSQVGRSEQSPIEKVKEQYWTAKQLVLQKLGKKEDGHLVASDAELDAKLELFGSIKRSSGSLKTIAHRYQKVMHELSKEEYALGLFLKKHGEDDPTKAGELLLNVAKAFIISAQKRMDGRAPLVRLAQDAATYQRCAVTDTERKIAEMEETRTEYRGALLWMKDASEELDPDTYRQLEKFRKVQHQVRLKKEKFDSQKLDTLQKIDLLAISRLNMLSQSLSSYGNALHALHEQTRGAFEAIPVPVLGAADREAKIPGALPSTSRNDAKGDDALLDLTESLEPKSSSSELLDAMWKESGSKLGALDLFQNLDKEPVEGKNTVGQDSETIASGGKGPLKFSDLDENEKDDMDLFTLDMSASFNSITDTDKSVPSDAAKSSDKPGSSVRSFFPSQLLKKGWTISSTSQLSSPGHSGKQIKDDQNEKWLNLFADLDPLNSRKDDKLAKTSSGQSEDTC